MHVLTRDHSLSATHTFIHKWNEPYLLLLPSRTASPQFGWYSFPVPLRVEGWVGVGSLVKYWGGLSAEDGHPSHEQVVKVIWQQAASPQHMDGSVVFARWCQCTPLPNTCFLNQNGISIGSAVFAGLTTTTDSQTDRQTDRLTTILSL